MLQHDQEGEKMVLKRIWRKIFISCLIVSLISASMAGIASADTGGLTVSTVGNIGNHFSPEYNPGDGCLWTMTTAGFDQIGKLTLDGRFTIIDGFVGGGGGASPDTIQMLHGLGSKGTLYVFDCNYGGTWWKYDAATGAKTTIGRNWTNPPAPISSSWCWGQISGMATNRTGTVLYHHVDDKIWALDPVARTAAVVVSNPGFVQSNALYKLEYDGYTDTLIGFGRPNNIPTIYRIDVKTGTVTTINVPGLSTGIWNVIPDSETGLLYTSPSPNPDGTIYEIDPVSRTFQTFALGAGKFYSLSSFGPARSGIGRSLYALSGTYPYYSVVEIAGTFPIGRRIPADSTPPVIVATVSPEANAAGWHNTDVTVSWTVEDPESGIVSVRGNETVTLTDETADSTLVCAATNGANLSSSQSATVRIDKTAPTITYNGNVGTYTVDQMVSITPDVEDALSGVASSNATSIVGPAYSFTLGANEFSATAIDMAGNFGSGSASFNVIVTYDSLGNLVRRFVTKHGIANSLVAKLNAAEAAQARGNIKTVEGVLGAFMNELSAQSGKNITDENAAILIGLAEALME